MLAQRLRLRAAGARPGASVEKVIYAVEIVGRFLRPFVMDAESQSPRWRVKLNLATGRHYGGAVSDRAATTREKGGGYSLEEGPAAPTARGHSAGGIKIGAWSCRAMPRS